MRARFTRILHSYLFSARVLPMSFIARYARHIPCSFYLVAFHTQTLFHTHFALHLHLFGSACFPCVFLLIAASLAQAQLAICNDLNLSLYLVTKKKISLVPKTKRLACGRSSSKQSFLLPLYRKTEGLMGRSKRRRLSFLLLSDPFALLPSVTLFSQ